MSNIDLSKILFPEIDEQINEAVVQAWMDRAKRGEGIPMPTLLRPLDGGKLVVIDGRQRLEAAWRMGETKITAYVIDEAKNKDVDFAELRKELNAKLRS